MIIVEIAGNLGADPEERFTATGKRVISLRVAARVRQGGQDVTVWWRVSVWDDRFDRMLPYLKKGSAVIIIGEMGKPETYVAKDGTTQISLSMNAEIIKFSPFGRSDGNRLEQQQQPYSQQASSTQEPFATFGASTSEEEHAFAGDDLPF